MRTRSQTESCNSNSSTPTRPQRNAAPIQKFSDETFVKGNVDQYERGYDRGCFRDYESDDRHLPNLDFVVADDDDVWMADDESESEFESESDSDEE